MLLKKDGKKILAGAAALIILAAGIYMALKSKTGTQGSLPSGKSSQEQPLEKTFRVEDKTLPPKKIISGTIDKKPDIDFKEIKSNSDLDQLMAERKKSLGIKQSLDMIVRSDEKFIVGGNRISMKEILEKAFTKKGEVFQEEITGPGQKPLKPVKEYGIYVVRPGDNIWNIHFNILKEFYNAKGVDVSAKADEPKNQGFSSGVGKILKFSETMVIIFNLIDRNVAEDINLLQPLSKVVVYNMAEVFSLLEEINYENVDRIQFDGRNIWIPAKKI